MTDTTRATVPPVVELDESTYGDRHGYGYDRTVRVGTCRLRARVRRDCYRQQSYAIAEVLSSDMTWTHLASTDPTEWLDRTARPGQGPIHYATELGDLTDRLIHRAAAILFE